MFNQINSAKTPEEVKSIYFSMKRSKPGEESQTVEQEEEEEEEANQEFANIVKKEKSVPKIQPYMRSKLSQKLQEKKKYSVSQNKRN